MSVLSVTVVVKGFIEANTFVEYEFPILKNGCGLKCMMTLKS